MKLKAENATLKMQISNKQGGKYEYPTEVNDGSVKALQELQDKYTELETSYEHYKEKTETEIMSLRERIRLADSNEGLSAECEQLKAELLAGK